MRRFTPRDFGDRRFAGWVLIGFGLVVLGVGVAGVALLVLGYFPTIRRATGFPIIAIVGGLGLVGVGWTNLLEARALEREARLRDVRARREGPKT